MREILFAAPLILYAGVRIWTLIKSRLLKGLFALCYVLLVSGFPVAETLSHRPGNGGAKAVIAAGYYALPLLLYLVLFVILFDLLVGLLRLVKALSKDGLRNPRFRRLRLSAYFIVPAAIVVFGIVNNRIIRVKEYTVDIPRKSSSITKLRIAFASDFHLRDMTEAGFLERFAAKVNALEPDIVLIGGDVLEGDRRDEKTERFESGFRRLKAKYGVFGVPGNHERYGGNRDEFFAGSGIRLLRDEVVTIDQAFYLAGRNDGGRWRSPRRKPLADLLKDTPADLPVILLDHSPTDLQAVHSGLVDIQLSGHTHMGQLFPVSLITQRYYELTWGYMNKRGTHVFVTSGIQLWGPPVRTAGRSEILLIDVVLK